MPELGWALVPQFHGKGYATEALRAAVAWGDQRFAQGRTVCIIHPDNHQSFRVAEKLGYKAIFSATGTGGSSIILARPEGWLRFLRQISLRHKWICRGG
jgi:RimJ/RimL family protein N-acetyltransferase